MSKSDFLKNYSFLKSIYFSCTLNFQSIIAIKIFLFAIVHWGQYFPQKITQIFIIFHPNVKVCFAIANYNWPAPHGTGYDFGWHFYNTIILILIKDAFHTIQKYFVICDSYFFVHFVDYLFCIFERFSWKKEGKNILNLKEINIEITNFERV